LIFDNLIKNTLYNASIKSKPYINSFTSIVLLAYTTILPLLSYDLRHLIALILLILRRFLQSVIVIFALKNKRSGSANIAGINNISKAIILRFRYDFL
jgi:hypothetical protein